MGRRSVESHTTAQQRHDIRLLFFTGGLTKPSIAQRLNVTLNQVKYAVRHGEEPRFSDRGTKPKLTEEQTNKLLAFVSSRPKKQRPTYAELARRSAEITGVFVGPDCIRSTLRRHGMTDPIHSSALRKKQRRADAQKDPQPASASDAPNNETAEDPSPSGSPLPQPAQETPLLIPEPSSQSPPDTLDKVKEPDKSVDDDTSSGSDVDDDDDATALRALETCDDPKD